MQHTPINIYAPTHMHAHTHTHTQIRLGTIQGVIMFLITEGLAEDLGRRLTHTYPSLSIHIYLVTSEVKVIPGLAIATFLFVSNR